MIERTPDELEHSRVTDERVAAMLQVARERIASYFLAEHYDHDVDNDHLVDAIYEGLKDNGVQDLATAIVGLLEDEGQEAAAQMIAEAKRGPRWTS